MCSLLVHFTPISLWYGGVTYLESGIYVIFGHFWIKNEKV